MALNTKTFDTLVAEMVAATQARSNSLLKLAIGSILRAVVEAVAGVVLWLQSMVVYVLAASRASTSTGADLDSWMADFDMTRVAATPSSGSVIFSRLSAPNTVSVPVGTTVESSDGSKKYTVIFDASNPKYDLASHGYTMAAGVLSVSVPVASNTAGSYSNAEVGEINTISAAILGVDTVTNTSAFTNGLDTESDDAFRRRFVLALYALSKATVPAVSGVIAPVRPGLKYNIVENLNFNGTPNDGYFHIVVDDGTGSPSAQVLEEVRAEVENCRPLTSKFDVYPPDIVLVDVTFNIVTPSVASHHTAAITAKQAVTEYVNGLGLGDTLSYTMLSKVVYDSDPSITDVTDIYINSGTSNVVPLTSQVLKAGTVVVS